MAFTGCAGFRARRGSVQAHAEAGGLSHEAHTEPLSNSAGPAERLVVIGRIVGTYGVRGWLKVLSFTADPLAILQYRAWQVGAEGDWQQCEVVSGRAHGVGVVVHLAGIADREQARTLAGREVAVARALLGSAAANEYFWADLEGLQVVTTTGTVLGQVSHLFATGANDVMAVRAGDAGREQHLIPFTRNVVQQVDLDHGLIIVNWDAGDLD